MDALGAYGVANGAARVMTVGDVGRVAAACSPHNSLSGR